MTDTTMTDTTMTDATMTAASTTTLPAQCPDSIGFARLHALVGRGYRPSLGTRHGDDGHVCIPFTHPRDGRKKSPPPAITLWSDGIVSTAGVLWPEKYVPSDEPPPDWQRYIMPEDEARFDGFVASIQRPNLVDLHLKPLWANTKLFALRMIFGATICTLIGFTGKLVIAEV